MTLSGPQRDELRLMVNGRDLGLYGREAGAHGGDGAQAGRTRLDADTLGEWRCCCWMKSSRSWTPTAAPICSIRSTAFHRRCSPRRSRIFSPKISCGARPVGTSTRARSFQHRTVRVSRPTGVWRASLPPGVFIGRGRDLLDHHQKVRFRHCGSSTEITFSSRPPRMRSACSACCVSATALSPFSATHRPPTLHSGSRYSASTDFGATARRHTTSMSFAVGGVLTGVFRAGVGESARCSDSSFHKMREKICFFARRLEQSKLNLSSDPIAAADRGNPAPVPTRAHAGRASAAQPGSQPANPEMPISTASGSGDRVRLVCWFQASSSSAYRLNAAAFAG